MISHRAAIMAMFMICAAVIGLFEVVLLFRHRSAAG
jgi:hypothetical protein